MPKSVVAGIAGAARVQRLTMSQVHDAEQHGLRLDPSSQARKIRDAEPLTTTGLDLAALRERHIEGAMVPKSKTAAIHLLIQFPTDLVDGEKDGQWMLDHARKFAEKHFGGNAVFADRLDRDEAGLHVVDLFLAPRYVKKTKHEEKEAISISKHLKDLAVATGRWDPAKGRDAPLIVQGQALQDVWFEYLKHECQLEAKGVARGSPKRTAGGDWMPSEVLDIERRQEEVTAKEAAAAEALETSQAMKKIVDLQLATGAKRSADAAALLAQAEAREAETVAAQRNVMALGVGVEAWVTGDVRPVQKDDGSRVMRYRDTATKERLSPVVRPVFEKLWDWMMQAAQAVAERLAELSRDAVADRVEAEKDRKLAAQERARAAALTAPEALQRCLEAYATPERVKRAIDAKITPEAVQRAVEAHVTPELVGKVVSKQVTEAQAVNSTLNAVMFAHRQRGQGR